MAESRQRRKKMRKSGLKLWEKVRKIGLKSWKKNRKFDEIYRKFGAEDGNAWDHSALTHSIIVRVPKLSR